MDNGESRMIFRASNLQEAENHGPKGRIKKPSHLSATGAKDGAQVSSKAMERVGAGYARQDARLTTIATTAILIAAPALFGIALLSGGAGAGASTEKAGTAPRPAARRLNELTPDRSLQPVHSAGLITPHIPTPTGRGEPLEVKQYLRADLDAPASRLATTTTIKNGAGRNQKENLQDRKTRKDDPNPNEKIPAGISIAPDGAKQKTPGIASEKGTDAQRQIAAHQKRLDRFFNAVRTVETGGARDARRAVGDGGRSRGPFQISRDYWADGCKQLGTRWDYAANVGDEERCRAVMLGFFARYAPAALATGDWERLARVHNGGPAGASKPATNAYWVKVRAAMGHDY